MEKQLEVAKALRALELRLLNPGIRKDRAAVASLLDEDFREFGASGRRFDRAEILALLEEESPSEIIIAELEIKLLTNNAALVTYRSRRHHYGDVAGDTNEARRSSIWVDRGEGWKMLFHQGTKIAATNVSGNVA
jgi:hypothetical protein